jgi:competence protein ComEC
LHVSILFGLIYVLTLRKRYLTGIIGIPLLILFAAIVGFTPSITRACIMQILMLIAMMVDREYDSPTALAFAVLAMLFVNPMTAASVSFQLSVGCMVGIFLFYEPISKWLEERKLFCKIKGKNFASRCKNWFISSVSVTISAGIITTPLVAVYFETVSLVGILTNLLTLWVVSFVFYGLLLVCGIGLISTAAASVIGWVIGWLIRYVVGVSKLLAALPLAAVYTKSLWIVLWLALTYGILTLYILSKRKRPLLFGCITAGLLCIAMLLSWAIPRLDHYRMTVVDVGQGQCILLQSDGRTYMVDCGGSSDRIAADQAAEYLLSQGIFRLDGIILTHYDLDHAGGVQNLLMRIPADVLYLPDISDAGTVKNALMGSGIPVQWVTEDTKLSYGKTEIAIFAPESTNGGNESGLCILFQREKCDILITGDRGQVGESILLSRTNLPQLDVLVAGHHGSDDSTGEALLKQTVPNTVVISAGRNNPYGHPGTALLERLAAWGCTVCRTDIMGTIIYRG